MAIYEGPDDAATRYLQSTTAVDLCRQMRPVVEAGLVEVGALSTYETLAEQFNRSPLGTKVDADHASYALDHASQALFLQVAREEAAICRNPVKRTTELLQQVFG